MTEIIEAGPVQRGLSQEKLAEVLPVGWHKFVAQKRADGSIGPMVVSTKDFEESPMVPQHSAMAEVCGLDLKNCIGGVAKFQEDGTFKFDDFLTPTTVGPTKPQQFEEAVSISNEQGYTVVSI